MSETVRPKAAPPEHFPELESLRGIALLIVVLFHAARIPTLEGYALPELPAFVLAGHTGVTLFFVLSAFLLSLPFVREAREGLAVNRRRFWARRSLRILPLYVFFVFLGFFFATEPVDLADRFVNALKSLVFWPEGAASALHPFSVAWWSLGTEAQFYALLPVIAWLAVEPARRHWLWPFAIAATALYIALWAGIGIFSGDPMDRWVAAHTLLGRAPAFLLGFAAAWLFEAKRERWRRLREDTRPALRASGDAALVAMILALNALLAWVVRVRYVYTEVHRIDWHGLEAALWTGILFAIVVLPIYSRRLFVNPIFDRLGRISYSFYLWHCPVLFFVIWLVDDMEVGHFALDSPTRLPILGASLALCWLLSELSYRWIERPFLRRKESLR